MDGSQVADFIKLPVCLGACRKFLSSILCSHAFIVVLGNTEPYYPDKHFAFES
jgi:hypothetical protein